MNVIIQTEISERELLSIGIAKNMVNYKLSDGSIIAIDIKALLRGLKCYEADKNSSAKLNADSTNSPTC